MTRLEKFQKVLELYKAFREENGITTHFDKRPYWDNEPRGGWFDCEHTSTGFCEKVDCWELLEDMNRIPGVEAKEGYSFDSTYGIAYTIAE